MPRHYFGSPQHYSFTINDDPHKRLWRQGRWFLYLFERNVFGIEWNLFRPSFGASLTFSVEDDNEIIAHLALPLLASLWVHVSMPRRMLVTLLPQQPYMSIPGMEDMAGKTYPISRRIECSIHHWSLWWHLWVHPHGGPDGYGGHVPRWREGSLDFQRLVLGSRQYTCANMDAPISTVVHMREGDYPVTLQRQHQEWWWPRIPKSLYCLRRDSFDARCDIGIPFPGKGENTYDCGEDGLYGTSFDCETYPTPEHVCQGFATVVYAYRRRYGGEQCSRDPWPEASEDRIRRVEALRAQNSASAVGQNAMERS